MATPLPAVPAYELESKTGPMATAIVERSPAQGNVYRLPAGYVNDDLCHPHDPPAALGQFYPAQKT